MRNDEHAKVVDSKIIRKEEQNGCRLYYIRVSAASSKFWLLGLGIGELFVTPDSGRFSSSCSFSNSVFCACGPS